MYDSRTLHRGSKNAVGSRILFLMSFQNKGAIISGPTFTISPEYANVSMVRIAAADDEKRKYMQERNLEGGLDDDDDVDEEHPMRSSGSGDDGEIDRDARDVPVERRSAEGTFRWRRRRALARQTSNVVRVGGRIKLSDFPIEPDTPSADASFVAKDQRAIHAATAMVNRWKEQERARREGFRSVLAYARWKEARAKTKTTDVD